MIRYCVILALDDNTFIKIDSLKLTRLIYYMIVTLKLFSEGYFVIYIVILH